MDQPDETSRWEPGQVPLEGAKWSFGGRVGSSTGVVGMLGWRDGKLVGMPEALAAVDAEIARRDGKPVCGVVLSRDDEAGAFMAAQVVMTGLYVGEAPELPEFDVAEPVKWDKWTARGLFPGEALVAAPVMPPLRPLSHGRESRGRRTTRSASRGSPARSEDEPDPEPLARGRRP